MSWKDYLAGLSFLFELRKNLFELRKNLFELRKNLKKFELRKSLEK